MSSDSNQTDMAVHGDGRVAPSARLTVAMALIIAVGVACGLIGLFVSRTFTGIDTSLPLTTAGVAVVCYLAAAATFAGLAWFFLAPLVAAGRGPGR